jgi:hypothetical protein
MFGVGVNMQFWCTSNFIFFGALVERSCGVRSCGVLF